MGHLEFLFLGTGGSSGIPMIGCHCEVCTSLDPCNKRLRPSGLLTWQGKRLLIDVGPDFRTQALRYGIDHLDGILISHSHYDHIAGIDELRAYYLHHRIPLPVLLSKSTYLDLKRRYDYFFQKRSLETSLPAQLDFHVIEEMRGEISFLDLPVGFTLYEQATMPVTGFRFGMFAYISDIRQYPDTIFDDLKGLEILVLSMLRQEASFMHLNLEEAIAFAKRVGASQTYFTHMSHEIEHAKVCALLPEGLHLAYDGLTLECQ
jgi:phosphoribosyl 1,2-cyclic phosphate phosphodiesterase